MTLLEHAGDYGNHHDDDDDDDADAGGGGEDEDEDEDNKEGHVARMAAAAMVIV